MFPHIQYTIFNILPSRRPRMKNTMMVEMYETGDTILKNYFTFNFFILKTCGMWIPKKDESFKVFKYAYSFILVFYSVCLYLPTEIAVLFDSWSLGVLVRSFRDMLNHLICLYKMFTWFRKRKQILEVIEILQSKEYTTYEEVDDYSPVDILKKHKKESDNWMKLFLVGVNAICINMCLSVLYVFIFDYETQYVEKDGKLIYDQKLPVTIRIPFERTSRTSVLLSFVFEIIPLDIYAWIIVGLDTLFTGLMSCVGAHLVILQGAFRTIRKRCLKKLNMESAMFLHDPETLNKEMMKEMRKCIRHLQCLIKVSDKIENIYNLQTCGQVLVSLFEMCFCLFLLSTAFNESFGPEFTYLFSTSFELLLYCWFGNEVTEAVSINLVYLFIKY